MLGTLKDLAGFIKENDDFAVITHFKPDGDAYGSALGLVGILRSMGKRAFPVCDDEVEPAYRFLANSAEFTNEEKALPFTPLCAIGVDVSDAHRMGKSENLFVACKRQGTLDEVISVKLIGSHQGVDFQLRAGHLQEEVTQQRMLTVGLHTESQTIDGET